MEEFSKPQYNVDVLKVEVPINAEFVEGSSVYKGQKAYTRAEALEHFREAAAVATKPFIYLSAGVSNAQFVEILNMATEAGTDFSGVLCGRATWKEGMPIYATKGAKALEDWLSDRRREEHQRGQCGADGRDALGEEARRRCWGVERSLSETPPAAGVPCGRLRPPRRATGSGFAPPGQRASDRHARSLVPAGVASHRVRRKPRQITFELRPMPTGPGNLATTDLDCWRRRNLPPALKNGCKRWTRRASIYRFCRSPDRWSSGPRQSLGLTLAKAFNDAASAAHRDHPKRFLAAATLPIQAPELAIQELERASQLPGVRAVYLPTSFAGRELDDKSLWPIYARCEQLGLPVLLHPVETVGRDRTAAHFALENLAGNPYDTGLAAAHLIFGGVLDAFPRLSVMLPHAGGTMPALIGRWDRGVEGRPELKDFKKPASSYLRRFLYDIIAHNDEVLMTLIRMVGADRIVLGSDFPFNMGLDRPVEVVERLKGLSAKQKDMILGGTAAAVLKA